MKKLENKKWIDFELGLLADIRSGRDIYAQERTDGDTPYVTAGTSNNGIGFFVGNDNDSKDMNVISVNRNGAVGEAFYHPYIALFGNDCRRVCLNEEKDANAQLFIAKLITLQKRAFSYSRKLGTARLKKLHFMLPVSEDNNPDYKFMMDYTKDKQIKLLSRYKAFCKTQISTIKYKKIDSLEEKVWKDYSITSLFSIIVSGKGKGLNHLQQTSQKGISYIGATNRNNGVLCFISDNKYSLKLTLPGNCIGFIKNGDGSAGYAIYKAESFISTSDVLYGYSDWINKYTGLFFVAAQDMIEHKYSHGYKRNRQHLEGDRVMLPSNKEGKPDFEYMEQYAKNMMLKKYKQYLAFLNEKTKAVT